MRHCFYHCNRCFDSFICHPFRIVWFSRWTSSPYADDTMCSSRNGGVSDSTPEVRQPVRPRQNVIACKTAQRVRGLVRGSGFAGDQHRTPEQNVVVIPSWGRWSTSMRSLRRITSLNTLSLTSRSNRNIISPVIRTTCFARGYHTASSSTSKVPKSAMDDKRPEPIDPAAEVQSMGSGLRHLRVSRRERNKRTKRRRTKKTLAGPMTCTMRSKKRPLQRRRRGSKRTSSPLPIRRRGRTRGRGGRLAQRRMHALRHRLRALRRAGRASKRAIRERQRLRQFLRQAQQQRSSGEAERKRKLDALLPVNDALESAAAWTLSEHRDPRTELEFTRHLLHAMLFSLASPIQETWDPYDVKPQVFALDQYIALPVFTNIKYLRLFCNRFNITVRDPSGVLWAAPQSSTESMSSSTTRSPALSTVANDDNTAAAFRYRSPPPYAHRAAGGITHEVTPDDAASDEQSTAQQDGKKVTTSRGSNEHEGNRSNNNTATPAHTVQEPSASYTEPASSLNAGMTADDLFADMENEEILPVSQRPSGESTKTRSLKRKRRKNSRTVGRHRGTARIHASLGMRRQKERSTTKRGKRDHHRDKAAAQQAKEHQREQEEARARKQEEANAAYTAHLQTIQPFQIQQARPLPTFGLPFLRPYCIGYFADVHTLLHNASILPQKVDIILNPGSPIEVVLARERTDEVLHGRGGGSYVGSSAVGLLRSAHQRVERVLRREFSQFFSRQCPEVRRSSSACVALPLHTTEQQELMENDPAFLSLRGPPRDGNRRRQKSKPRGGRGRRVSLDEEATSSSPLQELMNRQWKHREALYSGGSQFEIVILVDSLDEAQTFYTIQLAKQQGVLLGHYSLDVIPTRLASDHVREAATVFYEGNQQSNTRTNSAPSPASTGFDGQRIHQGDQDTLHSSHASDSGEETTNSRGWLSGFRQAGDSVIINPQQSPESFFHDPSNAYTEPHSIFTEELKYRGGH